MDAMQDIDCPKCGKRHAAYIQACDAKTTTHVGAWSERPTYACTVCGAESSSGYTPIRCDACTEKREAERYAKREKRPHGDRMVYSNTHSRYFDDFDDFLIWTNEVMEDSGTPADLAVKYRLLTTEPVMLEPIDLYEHYADVLSDLYEDQCNTDNYLAALDAPLAALNAAIEAHPPIGWMASRYAVEVT